MLHNDRKSRHRRIKKQRRYGRLAATSQFLSTGEFAAGISSCTNPTFTRDDCDLPTEGHHFLVGVACTLGPWGPTPYHALNRSVLSDELYPSRLLIIQSPDTISRASQALNVK